MLMDFLTRDIRGNYVVIQHDEREYSLMAHFIPMSIIVKKGDTVKKGQVIGKCGNSRNSSEPHLHFQLQDNPNFYTAIRLHIKFSNLKINKSAIKEEYVRKSEKVENLI